VEKIRLSDIRSQFPMYGDVSDEQLLMGLRKKFYSDIPPAQFYNRIDFDTQRKDPTAGMSGTEKFLAGVGKSFADLGRTAKRLGNKVGIGDYDEAAAKRDEELDKPLMATGAGMAGNIAGDLALTAVPGYRAQQLLTRGAQAGARVLPMAAQRAATAAAPYAGAAGAGAAVGAATSPDDLSGGAAMGAAAGALGEGAGRVLTAAYKGGKTAIEPLWESGRERVLRRTLERFESQPGAVARGANAPQYVPGVTPTLAEATMDPGIAQLQRGAASQSPDVASALAEARGRQVAGYRQVLDDLAGTDGRREFFDNARTTAADQLYGRARAEGLQMTAALEARMAELMKRPSVQRAMQAARSRGREKGLNINDARGSVAGLETVVDEIGGMIGRAKTAGDADLAKALTSTRNELLSVLDEAAPAFGEARRTYAAMSRPVNQMDIGQQLRNTALPALDELGNSSLARVNANAYAKALRNADKTARQATGLRSATMADVLEPQQMAAVEGVGQDMARYAASQELARVPGSPTAQYMAAQNVVRQFLGPLGVPASAADALVGSVSAGLLGLPYKFTQSQTEQLLARALTDPQTAARIMQVRDPKTIAEILQPYAAQAAVQYNLN
jgi:hypothetical protein